MKSSGSFAHYGISNSIFILSLLIFFSLLGLVTAQYSYYSILITVGLFILVFAIIYPIETNLLILSLWGIAQSTLTKISIAGIPFSQGIMLAIIFPLIIGLLARGNTIIKNKNNILVIVYLIWALWNIVGIFTTMFVGEALVLYSRLIIGMLIFLLFALGIKSYKETNFIANAMILCGTISALITIVQLVLYSLFGFISLGDIELVRYYSGDSYRPIGTFSGPVSTAVTLFCMYLAASHKYLTTMKKSYLCAAIIIAAGMLCTLTRTTALTLVLTIIFQSIQLSLHKKKFGPVIKIIGLVVIFASVTSQFALEAIEKRFLDVTAASSVDDLGAGRVGIWVGIIKGVINESGIVQLFIGNGISSAKYFVSKYSVFGFEDYTHNDYLDTAVSNGIFSLLLLLAFIFLIFRLVASGSRKIRLGFYFPFFFYFAIVMMLSNTNFSAGQRWFFLLLLAYLLNEIKFENDSQKPVRETG